MPRWRTSSTNAFMSTAASASMPCTATLPCSLMEKYGLPQDRMLYSSSESAIDQRCEMVLVAIVVAKPPRRREVGSGLRRPNVARKSGAAEE